VDLPNHGDSNWPRGIADRQTEIGIIRSLVLALLHIMYDLRQTRQHDIREGLRLLLSEHGRENKIPKRSRHTLDRINLKRGLRYSAD
jgi:hypothetical protein